MNGKWHWIKDNDYPVDGQEVWCIIKGYVDYFGKAATFSKDLCKLDENVFFRYKDQKYSGFYDFDNGWNSYVEIENVVCWIELPGIPDELKKEKDE